MYNNNQFEGSEEITLGGVIGDCCIALILIVAAYNDYTEYRVSNRVILTGWIMALLFAVYYGGLAGVVSCFMNILISIVLFFFLFRFRLIGAGDIKLLSVISGFLGVSEAINVFVAAIFVGSIFSIIKCIHYGYLINRLSYFRQYVSGLFIAKKIRPYYLKERDGDSVVIPFSIAIGIGWFIVKIGVLS